MIDLTALNFFDYAVVVILVISGILATFRGFIREFLGILGWILAVIFARLTQPFAQTWLEDFFTGDSLIEVLAWTLPFVIFVLAWFVLANMMAPGLKKFALGGGDRPLGFIFGLARGAVVVSLIYMGVLVMTESERSLPQSVLESTSITPMRVIATVMTGFAPEDIQDVVKDAIPKQDSIEATQDVVDGAVEDAENLLDDEQ